ncbi:hypothetical protein Ctob_009964 [Chrysochromulina tobinii]|uniref:Membrane transport protein MMPL domain-containing protein n=1 Tax=Chrysochromulina tobinii TaxID=1460289 RepID=A0A0M0JLF9_9EUKA|nr:hypothetical protein Ctob_009964 [Chrysochromulina tobinii]|eukprot:KOO27414.1 hypothetical protein Ctob_009964 [Chrysochromulina sp. CCMP291]
MDFDALIPRLSTLSDGVVELTFGGDGRLTWRELYLTLFGDLVFIGISIGAIHVFLLAVLPMPLFTTFSLLVIMLCFPVTIALYLGAFGQEQLPVLSIVSIYLVLGIGSDYVFIFTNTIQPERHRAKIHFVFGIKATPRRGLIDGIPTGSDLDTAQQAVLLDGLSQELIAALCERLELAPPYHVLPGTIKCPLLTLKRKRLAAAAAWPVPADDVLPLLRSLELSAEASQLVGVRKDAITERQSIIWLAVSAHTNVPSGGVGEGSTAALRAESEWFEGVALTANEKAAAEGSILRGWQTSSAYVMMEAFDEVVSGTAGCVISGALLTAATLLILTGSLSLTISTLVGVVVVLICFIGYLVERGYELGVIEAIATTIFIGFACDYCVHIGQVYRTSHGNFTRMLEH